MSILESNQRNACLIDSVTNGYTTVVLVTFESLSNSSVNHMTLNVLRLLTVFLVVSGVGVTFLRSMVIAEENELRQTEEIESIPLDTINGERRDFGTISQKPYLTIIFLGTECPLVKIYLPQIAEIAEKYQDLADVIGVDSNSQDTLAEISSFVHTNQISFPIYRDHNGQLATALGAKRTPEALIINRQGDVLYQGRIDDQYGVGYSRETARKEYLKDALAQLKQNIPIGISRTEPVGCFIGRNHSSPKRSGIVTYQNRIASIMEKHCVECHQEGEIGPFALTEYEDVAAWSETIGEVIEQGRMPPWHANPAHGSFANARKMSPEERDQVARWIKEGCPQGTEQFRPPKRLSVSGWQLNAPPDLIFSMRETPFTVPADGTVEYQYFVVDPKFTEDRWVTAAEVVPGNRSVVHHAIVFISAPGQQNPDNYGWLAAYVPGQRIAALKPGQARLIPAGSRFIFQMHYTPNGSVQEDQTKIGLIFTSADKVDEEVMTLVSANRHFKIPPGDANYRVNASLTEFPENAKLTALTPHMHLRGKSFRITEHDQTDHKTILLDVPQYDFNWQHIYRLADPLPLDDIKKIECIAHFDNSERNVVNPDAASTVRWGDQSWEEMMIAFFEISVPRKQGADESRKNKTEIDKKNQRIQANALASEWIAKWDHNSDSFVQRDEVGESFRRFAFAQVDRNQDQQISLMETADYISDTLTEERQQEALRRLLDQLQ